LRGAEWWAVKEIELGAGRRVRVDRGIDAEELGRVLDVLSLPWRAGLAER
jgi:hypothetical protein